MIPAACFDLVTGPAWAGLSDELAAWAAQGKIGRLWWRDDDAVAPTAQLDDLLGLADGVPIGLAVIPAAVRPKLADRLKRAPSVTVLQHGWRHANHGGEGKKSEFPASRVPAQVADELSAGCARLTALFGDRFLPVLAPPWNRFAPEFAPLLAEAGLIGLSGLAQRHDAAAAAVPSIHVHLDLVDWRGGRGFIGESAALGALTGQLRARRLTGDSEAPVGILTHHRIMDRPTAAFLADLLDRTRCDPAVRWSGPEALLVQ